MRKKDLEIMQEAQIILQKIMIDHSHENILRLLNQIDHDYYSLVSELLLQLDSKRDYALQVKYRSQRQQDFKTFEYARKTIKELNKVQKDIRTLREEHLFKEFPDVVKTKNSENPYLRRESSAYYGCLLTNYAMNERVKQLFKEYDFEMPSQEKLDLLKIIRDEYELERSRLKKEKVNIVEEFCQQFNIDTGIKLNSIYQKQEIKDFLKQPQYIHYYERIEQVKNYKRKVNAILDNIHLLMNLQKEFIMREEKQQKRKQREDNYPIQYEEIFSLPGCLEDQKKIIETLKLMKHQGLTKNMSILSETVLLLEHADKELRETFIYWGYDILRKKHLSFKEENFSLKEREIERYALKQWEKYFSQQIIYFSQEKQKYPKDYYYLIMNSLLDEDRNYFYIASLLKELPEFRSARNEDGVHILIDILDRYIVNMKYKLLNQKIPFLDPEYYKKVFDLYFETNNYLFPEEKEELKNRISELKEYVKKKKYADSEKVYSDLEEMEYDIVAGKPKEKIPGKKISFDLLNQKLLYFISHGPENGYADLTDSYHMILECRINCFKEKFIERYGQDPSKGMVYDSLQLTKQDLRNVHYVPRVFTFEGTEHYAYSVYYDENGDTYIRFHLLDMASMIDEDSKEEQMLKDKQLNKNNNHFQIPKFEKGNSYPTITLEVPIYKNGKIGQVVPFDAIVEISDVYGIDDIQQYRNEEELKQLISSFKRLNLSDDTYISFANTSDMKQITNDAINKVLKILFEEYNIPFVYCNRPTDNEELIQRNHNQTCYLLSKVSKWNAHRIFDILDQPIEKAYNLDMGDDSQIEIDPTNYLGIYLQRLLKKISRGNYDLTLRRRPEEEEEIQKLIQELNETLGYVPELQKRRKRKKKK